MIWWVLVPGASFSGPSLVSEAIVPRASPHPLSTHSSSSRKKVPRAVLWALKWGPGWFAGRLALGALLQSLTELPGDTGQHRHLVTEKQGTERICPENEVSKLGTLGNKTENQNNIGN